MFDEDVILRTYLMHVLIAWPLLFLAQILLAMLLLPTPLANALDRINAAPYFPFTSALGLAFGLSLTWRHPCKSAALVFVFPAIVFVVVIVSDYLVPPPWGGWHAVWQAYFSNDCSASGCVGEFLFTGPLYGSVAYSVGALLASSRWCKSEKSTG